MHKLRRAKKSRGHSSRSHFRKMDLASLQHGDSHCGRKGRSLQRIPSDLEIYGQQGIGAEIRIHLGQWHFHRQGPAVSRWEKARRKRQKWKADMGGSSACAIASIFRFDHWRKREAITRRVKEGRASSRPSGLPRSANIPSIADAEKQALRALVLVGGWKRAPPLRLPRSLRFSDSRTVKTVLR